MRETIVLLGAESELSESGTGSSEIVSLAGDFGWNVELAHSSSELKELNGRHRVVAVIVSPSALLRPLVATLRQLKRITPDALLVVCQSFSDTLEWPALAEAGAFLSLRIPLHRDEIRHTLGFLWEASVKKRREREIDHSQSIHAVA